MSTHLAPCVCQSWRRTKTGGLPSPSNRFGHRFIYFFNLVNPGGAECAVTYHQTRPFRNETVFQYFFAHDPDKHFKPWLWCFVKKRSSCPLTKTTFALVFRSSWASRSCWTSQTSKTQHKQRLTQSTGGCSRSGLPSWFLVVDPPHARAPPPPPPLSFCFDVPHTSNISSLFQIYHEQVSRVWCERLFTNVDVYQSNRNRRRVYIHILLRFSSIFGVKLAFWDTARALLHE